VLNGLDLFSGIGGITVALKEWVCPIAYVEIDPYCQGVLLSRGLTGDIPCAPIWDDIKTLDGKQFRETVDIIYGGFPCQGISVAGLGQGLEDERSGLFFEIVRLCGEIEPRWVFLENVPAIVSRGGVEVGRCFAEMGYDCRWCVISAASIGAPHKRQRWFLLSHPKSQGWESRGNAIRKSEEQSEFAICNLESHWWQKDEPELAGMANGIPYRMDRIKSLGNAVVPQQAKKAFEILMGITK